MDSSILKQRDIRQRDLIPPARLAECEVLVIGVGAIGRQVALQLAAVGVPRMTLYDDDIVAVENLAHQGYWPEDLEQKKVTATGLLCQRINPDIELTPVPERFRRSAGRELRPSGSLIVFCCVDSITTRKLIWESASPAASLFVDGRMSAEVLRVLAIEMPDLESYYASTLFQASEAYTGACTAKSTIYTASIAAGLMVGQFTKWLRRLPVDNDMTLNLLSMELTCTCPTH